MPDQFNQRPQSGQPEWRSDPFGNDPTEPMIELPAAPQPLALPPPHGDLALPQGTLPAQPLPGAGAPVPNWPPGTPPPPWQPGPPPPFLQPAAPTGQPGAAPTSAQPGTPATAWQAAAPAPLLPPASGPYEAPANPTIGSQSQPSAPAESAASATSQSQPPSAPPKRARRPIFTPRRAQITLMVGLVFMVVCVVPVWVFGVWVWWSGHQHEPPPVLATLHTSGQAGNQLVWSPDGKYLAEQITLPGGTAGDSKGAAVIIWDVATGQEVRRFTDTDGGLAVAWSPDGKLLATTNGNHTLIWRTAEITVPGNTAEPLALLNGHSKYDQISALAFGPEGVLAVADDGGVDLFQAAKDGSWKQLVYVPDSLCATTPCARALSWSPDGSWLLAAPWHLDDGTSGVGALDTRTWKQAAFLDASTPLAWSPDSSEVLMRASDETTLVALHAGDWTTSWSINPNTDIHQGYNVYPQAAGWSPDNTWLVGSADGWVDLWPLSTHHSAWVWNEQHPSQHIYAVNSLAWSPDSHALALTTDGTANITLYDMRNPSPPL